MLDSTKTRGLGVVGQRGVVTGLPPHLLGIDDVPPAGDPGADQYTVALADEAVALSRRDLRPTGDRVNREAIYDGSSLRIDVDGEPVEFDQLDGLEP